MTDFLLLFKQTEGSKSLF